MSAEIEAPLAIGDRVYFLSDYIHFKPVSALIQESRVVAISANKRVAIEMCYGGKRPNYQDRKYYRTWDDAKYALVGCLRVDKERTASKLAEQIARYDEAVLLQPEVAE